MLRTTVDTIPANVPYLFADPVIVEQWQEKLSSVGGFRIGINWRGRSGGRESRQRDVPVEMFERLANVQGIRLVNLQKEERRIQSTALRQEQGLAAVPFGSRDLGNFDTDRGAFVDTASVMMNLDLVISSDTAVPHVAGALGVPVWVALPFVPDWRWMLDREDSPWYPTMRLFRQKQPGDWELVFAEIEMALRDRV